MPLSVSPAMQAALYGQFIQKVRTGQPYTIACRGDSLTYGQDTTSSDRTAPPAGHSRDRAPVQYPSALSSHLGSAATVINQGYSGDWAKRSYERWDQSAGSDLTIIGLGINDSRADWSEYPGEIGPFIEWYEKIILRELAWGSACMIMLPLRQRGTESADLGAYRAALRALSANYGIPVFDGAEALAGYGAEVFSDDTHLNAKGYKILGVRAAMALMDAASSYGAGGNMGGGYYLPVPAVYDESADITTTRIRMQDILDRLGVPPWGSWRAQAPAFKITVRTYEQAVIEYLVSVNASPTGATGAAVEKVHQLRRTNIPATPNESRVREINTITWDAATKEWVIGWKTSGKNLRVNFNLVISLL